MRVLRTLVRALGVAALGAGALIAVAPGVAGAAPGDIDLALVVDSFGAGADADAGDGVCATVTSVCTLQAAIDEATTAPGTGVVTIKLGAGTFTLGESPTNIVRPIAISGAGATSVIDLADGLGFAVDDTEFSLAALEIRNGLRSDGNGGAAISALEGDLDLTDVRLVDNRSDGDGGAVTALKGSLTMTRVEARENAGQSGGAVFATLAAVKVNGSTFVDNHSSAGGGALYFGFPRSLSIAGSTFTDNATVGQGGAVAIVGVGAGSNATFTITDSTFTANVASADGGAVFVSQLDVRAVTAALTITKTSFTGNSAEVGGALATNFSTVAVNDADFDANRAANGSGGAIAAGGPLTVTGSTFTDNFATDAGGAISTNGPTTITGSQFTGNRTDGIGGALDLFGPTTPTVTGNTFTGNHADVGGGAIRRLGTDLAASGNSFSGNTPEGEDVVVETAPTSDGPTPTTSVATTTTSPSDGGQGQPTDPTDPSPGDSGDVGGSETGNAGGLPFTGASVGGLLGLAVILVVVGLVSRRRRAPSAG